MILKKFQQPGKGVLKSNLEKLKFAAEMLADPNAHSKEEMDDNEGRPDFRGHIFLPTTPIPWDFEFVTDTGESITVPAGSKLTTLAALSPVAWLQETELGMLLKLKGNHWVKEEDLSDE